MQVGRLIGFGLEGGLTLGTYLQSCPETCRVLDTDLSTSSDISYIEPLYSGLPIVSVSTNESCVLARVFYWNVYLRKETTGCGKQRRERENKGLLPWKKARLHFSHKSNERVKEKKGLSDYSNNNLLSGSSINWNSNCLLAVYHTGSFTPSKHVLNKRVRMRVGGLFLFIHRVSSYSLTMSPPWKQKK